MHEIRHSGSQRTRRGKWSASRVGYTTSGVNFIVLRDGWGTIQAVTRTPDLGVGGQPGGSVIRLDWSAIANAQGPGWLEFATAADRGRDAGDGNTARIAQQAPPQRPTDSAGSCRRRESPSVSPGHIPTGWRGGWLPR